jgi:hypothetical protein
MGATFAAGHPLDLTDVDHDKIKNWADNCPENNNADQKDTDGDMAAPVVDQPAPNPSVGPVRLYPYTPYAPGVGAPTALPTDKPADVGGDVCDSDDDSDGVTDQPRRDNCRTVANKDQADSDFDGRGDACDTDDDNDNALDGKDNCPLVSNSGQVDFDRDGLGDACDPDGPKASTSGLQGGDPNDRKAPKVAVVTRTVLRFDELGRGLAIAVRCDEGCSLDGQLQVAGRRVSRGAAQIARRGNTWVFLSFTKQTFRKLTRKGRVVATFKLVAKDANGNRVLVRKRLTLRR